MKTKMDGFITSSTESDIITEQEYRRTLGLDYQEIVTKPQKINYLLSKRNWKKSDLKEKTPQQLYRIMQKI